MAWITTIISILSAVKTLIGILSDAKRVDPSVNINWWAQRTSAALLAFRQDKKDLTEIHALMDLFDEKCRKLVEFHAIQHP